jgi:hypothetical protein
MVANISQILSQLLPVFDVANDKSLSNLISNGFIPWWNINSFSAQEEVVWLTLLLFVSSALWLCAERSAKTALLHTASLTLLTVSLFGGDRLLLRGAVTLSATLMLLNRVRSPVLLFVLTLGLSFFSTALAVPIMIIAACWHYNSKEQAGSAYVIIVAALISLSFFNSFGYPEYPAGAHLVADDGVQGLLRPLLGPDANIQIIDRGALREHYAPIAQIIFLLTLVSSALFKGRARLYSLLFAVCGLIDCLVPEATAQIAPVQSIARLVPYLLYFPLAPFVLFSALLFSVKGFSEKLGNFICIIIICFSSFLLSKHFSCNISDPAQKVCALKNKAVIFSSPSARIFIDNSAERIARSRFYALNNFELIKPNAEGLPRILDDHSNSRLKLNNKTLDIHLLEPQTLSGIVLDPGGFSTDFPRSFVVKNSDNGSVIFYSENWQGPINFSAETALPYYGAQQDVIVLFDSDILASGLAISIDSQKQQPYDWSVAEVRIIKPKQVN